MTQQPWTRILAAAALAAPALAALAAPGPCERSGAAARTLVTDSHAMPPTRRASSCTSATSAQRTCSTFRPGRILLFVHGATYPSETAFDLPLDGFSWMDYIACRGFDVYLVDLRGYGRSTRPAEMAQPAKANTPIVHQPYALATSALPWISSSSVAGRELSLLGWSWGTSIMATYTAANNEKVNKLVLYAPLWLRTTPAPIGGVDRWAHTERW